MSWGNRRSYYVPQPLPLDYGVHLAKYNADVVKRVARTWVGKDSSKLAKDACTKAIVSALADPAVVERVIAGLSPFEAAGLGLLKHYGQTAPTLAFAVELLMLGFPLQSREKQRGYGYHYGTSLVYTGLNSLLGKGLVLLRDTDHGYGAGHTLEVDQYHYRPEVFSDRHLLASVAVVPPVPLPITPVADVGESGLALQPAQVVLRFVSLTEALRKMSRIELTRKGRPAKPFLTKLGKALGWEATLEKAPETPLSQATLFYFKLCEGAGLLEQRLDLGGMSVRADAQRFFEAPYHTQSAAWIAAYRSLPHWLEIPSEGGWMEDEDPASVYSSFSRYVGMRAAVLMALAALPDAGAWYRLSDLSEAIHQRIGLMFSLGSLHNFYPHYNATPEQVEEQREQWEQQRHAGWRKSEEPWIARAVAGPLFHLGLVALAHESRGKKTTPTLFRLTQLGRAVLYDAFRDEPAGATDAGVPAVVQDGPCWVVQPNFDVVVYLDRASAARLTFIERIAERKPATGATALYHLSRESVYAALESGISADTLVETLRLGCDYPLPGNIQQTVADWAARREQLTVYRVADVVEFPDQQARDAALARRKDGGVAVGERYILLVGEQRRGSLAARVSRTVNYVAPRARCLQVTEDGVIEVVQKHVDLLVHGELAAWADAAQADASRWQVTCQSVQKAVRAGWTADTIVENLRLRLLHDLPPLLFVAIRAWAGVPTLPTAVAVATDLVLQVSDLEVARAIGGSALLQPYLRGRLGRQSFLVKHETADDFRARLAEFGLQVGDDLAVLGPGWKD